MSYHESQTGPPTPKKAEDVCKRLTSMGFKLAFVFGNSPISADAKVSHQMYKIGHPMRKKYRIAIYFLGWRKRQADFIAFDFILSPNSQKEKYSPN